MFGPRQTKATIFERISIIKKHSNLVFQDYVMDKKTEKVRRFLENPLMDEDVLNYLIDVREKVHTGETRNPDDEKFWVRSEKDKNRILSAIAKKLDGLTTNLSPDCVTLFSDI
jgi:hypothetical protein